MNRVEQIVEKAKAAGEQSVLVQINESEASELLAQANALGNVKGYVIQMDQSELDALARRASGNKVDLSQSEINALVDRALVMSPKQEAPVAAPVNDRLVNADIQAAIDQLVSLIGKQTGMKVIAMQVIADANLGSINLADLVAEATGSVAAPTPAPVRSVRGKYGVKPDGSRFHNVRDASGRFVSA